MRDDNIYTFNLKWDIADTVYHITGGNAGIVLDATYSVRNRSVRFLIAFDQDKDDWYYEEELSTDKIIM